MAWGILDLLGSATTIVFAMLPAAAGLELLWRGEIFFGVGLLAAAAAMLIADRYIISPGDLPVLAASKLVETVVGPSDEE